MLPKRLSRKTVYKSEWVELHLDEVEMPGGRIINPYHLLEYPFDSVTVLMLNNKNQIAMIRSLRYSSQTVEWEIPAGGIDAGESPKEAGLRECYEETGYRGKDAINVQFFYPSNGMSTERIHIIKCMHDGNDQNNFDKEEVESVEWKSKDEVRQLILDGDLKDGKSLLPVSMWLADLI